MWLDDIARRFGWEIEREVSPNEKYYQKNGMIIHAIMFGNDFMNETKAVLYSERGNRKVGFIDYDFFRATDLFNQ